MVSVPSQSVSGAGRATLRGPQPISMRSFHVVRRARLRHLPGSLVCVRGDHASVAQQFDAVDGVRAAHSDVQTAFGRSGQPAAHRRIVAGEVQFDAVTGDTVDAAAAERFPQAVTRQFLGQTGHQSLSPVAGHIRPVVRGADRAQVQAGVQRSLVGAAARARSHVRIVAQADPLLVGLGAAVDGEDLGVGAQRLVAVGPVRCALAGQVGCVVGDGERVHVQPAQIGVQFGQRLRRTQVKALAAVDDVVVAPASVALPLVAGEGHEGAGPVMRCGRLLHFGPLQGQYVSSALEPSRCTPRYTGESPTGSSCRCP